MKPSSQKPSPKAQALRSQAKIKTLHKREEDFKSGFGNRTRYEIIVNVLELCQNDMPLTRVMQKSNLNYGTTRKYMEKLIQAGFIEKLSNCYHTTWLGAQFLRHFEELQKVFTQKEVLSC